MVYCYDLLMYLHPTLGPGAVLPAVAGSDRAGLPLLHLRRAGPAVALRGLNHRPPPPHLTWRKHTGSDIISDIIIIYAPFDICVFSS